MKKYISLFLLATAAIITSCVDDKGSYDLSPINEMEITLSNEDGYTAYIMGDPVLISADVKGTMAEENAPDRYAYHWYVKIITELASQAYQVIDLSTEREFTYTAGDDLVPGDYTLYLEVEDKETGLKALQQTTLSIASQTTTGFLVLGETADGSVKMDMIATMAEDTVLMEDVFTDSNIKAPEALFFTGYLGEEGQNLWLTTATQSYSLTNGSYFKLLEDNHIDDKILTSFDVKRPMRVLDMYPHQDASSGARTTFFRGYITDDAVYQINLMAGGGLIFGNPVNRYNTLSAELFKPYPLAFIQSGYISGTRNYVVLYDMDNQIFVAPDQWASTPTICNKLQGGTQFNWDQTTYSDNRRLVFGQNGNKTSSYALLTDDQNKWYIYKFKVSSNTNPVQELAADVDLSKAKDFDKATFYAFSDLETEIVYAVGSQLWAYDYERQIAKMLKDYGKPIIYLIRDIESTTNNSNFCIATSSGDGTSTLSWFTLGENPDDIIFEEDEDMVWEINSRIKAVQWKNAGDLEDESGYY